MRRVLAVFALTASLSAAFADDDADIGALVDNLPDGGSRPVARQIEDEIKLDPQELQRSLSELIVERDFLARRSGR